MKINPVYFENYWGKFTKIAVLIILLFSLLALYKYSQLTDEDWQKWEEKQEMLRDSLKINSEGK